ncbi:hypothetical protein FHS95_003698 [Sphingomonas naasensis]|uniref:DUF4893 domain-containing protein n=1 Tax=Sphingomonas naasensis TaxID=1344951 RepID=A0A4V3QWF6_9SPHN|nr:DUF4893 domain-containing protein [Sphingomonas naasensis]NIJ21987.1 hypothetical protein [Sphingomonas naasensis]TGX42332.1 DUF4893 domain-containing protein [Sphingomonas naasensis]
MYRRIATLALCSTLAACATKAPPRIVVVSPVTIEEPPAWRTSIKREDEARLQALRAHWDGLHARLSARVRTAQGSLVDPAAGLDLPALSPGSYRCRVVRLRTPPRGPATVRSSSNDFCFISGAPDGVAFVKQTGNDPAAGYFYPDGKRYVFLGARQRRAGENSVGYGNEPTRDMVGVVERVGSFRWRLAVAGVDARQVDIYELTPVPADQQPKS